jgi:ParB-like chromosome segregation protein Spo0J/DNA modification methylase
MLKIIELDINQISVGERARKDLGDLKTLKDSIERDGQLNPILVNEDYKLIAGERRLQACRELELPTVLARVMPGLTPDDQLVIEMIENTARKDFEWYEEIELKYKIHSIWKTELSTKQREWGYRETAERLKVSLGTMGTDMVMAEALAVFPELKELKNKAQAREAYKKIQAQAASVQALDSLSDVERENLQRMMAGQAPKMVMPQAKHEDKMLCPGGSINEPGLESTNPDPSDDPGYDPGESASDECSALPQHSYQVSSFEPVLADLPDGTVGYAELDPPYAIKFNETYGQTSDIKTATNQDWTVEMFHEKMQVLLTGLWPKLLDKSWVLCWTGKEHAYWINELARGIGYHTQDPGVWVKTGGSTNKPKCVMVSSYETFLLLRKGEATFNTPSFSNVVQQNTVHASTRGHQWEKPMELYNHFARALSRPGSIFFSPFAGSGNSMISAALNQMMPIGCDESQEYLTYFYKNLRAHFI